jgi:hypothetical protein
VRLKVVLNSCYKYGIFDLKTDVLYLINKAKEVL